MAIEDTGVKEDRKAEREEERGVRKGSSEGG